MLHIPTRKVMMLHLREKYSGMSRMRDSSALSLSKASGPCYSGKPTREDDNGCRKIPQKSQNLWVNAENYRTCRI